MKTQAITIADPRLDLEPFHKRKALGREERVMAKNAEKFRESRSNGFCDGFFRITCRSNG